MDITRSVRNIVIAAALAASAGTAMAAPQMKVIGRVEVDGVFPPFDSNQLKIEDGTPAFTNSAIEVSDTVSGVWEYLARVDSTVPKLQVAGSITNNTGSVISDFELGALSTFASYTDTITVSPGFSDPYLVSIDMVVDGVLQIDESIARAAAGMTITPVGKLQSNDFSNYTSTGVVHDVLSAQYAFVGEAVFDLNTNLQFSIQQVNPGVTASGDFSHTAIINLSFTRLNGDPIPGQDILVNSESGFFGTAPVPAPPALPLLVAGLVGLCLRARRRVG